LLGSIFIIYFGSDLICLLAKNTVDITLQFILLFKIFQKKYVARKDSGYLIFDPTSLQQGVESTKVGH
jgi:hypothetical protein